MPSLPHWAKLIAKKGFVALLQLLFMVKSLSPLSQPHIPSINLTRSKNCLCLEQTLSYRLTLIFMFYILCLYIRFKKKYVDLSNASLLEITSTCYLFILWPFHMTINCFDTESQLVLTFCIPVGKQIKD